MVISQSFVVCNDESSEWIVLSPLKLARPLAVCLLNPVMTILTRRGQGENSAPQNLLQETKSGDYTTKLLPKFA